jgi:lipoate-protein ligase A
VQRVLISGDFFVTPPRVVFDLESALQGVRLDEIDAAIEQFFSSTEVDTLSVSPDDFKASITNALEQRAAHG